MKKYILSLLAVLLVTTAFSQSAPPAPGTGIYALLDTTYKVGTQTEGVTKVRLTLQNNTSTKTTAVQFRVFYDKNAFNAATAALVSASSSLDIQFVDNPSNGFITITLVYTGSSSTYSLPTGEVFEVTLTHVTSTTFQNLTAIDSVKWTGTTSFQQYAATQAGADTSLTLYSYGGAMVRPSLKFHGRFVNVTGTGAKNIIVALEKKPKTGSTWTVVDTSLTTVAGAFSFDQFVDTTYWNARITVKGDTLTTNTIVSTSDAAKVNQYVLGTATPTGFDYYAADVNGSNSITISDVYGIFARLAGRFTAWPNTVPDVKFFTQAQYSTINGSSTNYTSTISGTVNVSYDIIAGGVDSVTYYVLGYGDANGTGFHMARITPIEIVNPANANKNVIDQTVDYDFPTTSIEVNVPKLKVEEGNLVNIPVRLFTNGTDISALQFGLKYNDTLLEFRGVKGSEASSKWVSYINPNNSQVDWGGFDISKNEALLRDGDEVITLQFAALKPQDEWGLSPLYTTLKFAGDAAYRDLKVTPTNGIVQVLRISGGGHILIKDNVMLIYPNPTDDLINIGFSVQKEGNIQLGVYTLDGKKVIEVITNEYTPEGKYTYRANLGHLPAGIYSVIMINDAGTMSAQNVVKHQ
jgi:hypothetical protein